MSDVNTPITGKDVRVVLTINGAVRQVQDQVTKFSAKPVYDEIVTKNLGVTGSKIDKVLTHWEGSIELAVERATLDELVDTVNAARRNRVPVVINITETISYRDGSSKRYTYPDIKADFESSASRGEAKTFTINWKSGQDRIAS